MLDNVNVFNVEVLVDNYLTFQPFVDKKYNEVHFNVNQLRKIQPYVTVEIACKIYMQTILPSIDIR